MSLFADTVDNLTTLESILPDDGESEIDALEAVDDGKETADRSRVLAFGLMFVVVAQPTRMVICHYPCNRLPPSHPLSRLTVVSWP